MNISTASQITLVKEINHVHPASFQEGARIYKTQILAIGDQRKAVDFWFNGEKLVKVDAPRSLYPSEQ